MGFVNKLPKEYSFEKIGIRGKIFESEHLDNKKEFVIIETQTGHDTTIMQKECDFTYYVLEGEGIFIINDKEEKCEKGDLVTIPKGNVFTYKGNLKLLLIAVPAWYEEQEVTLK